MTVGLGFKHSESTQPCCPAKGMEVTVQTLLPTSPANFKQILYAGPALEALWHSVPSGLTEAVLQEGRAVGQTWL